jgi:DNA-binding response OmpR family regulator
MYAEWFRQAGYCTLQAESAEEGIRLASEESPVVAVVALGPRPADEGLQLTRLLKTTAATRHVRVVVVAGFVLAAPRYDSLKEGCDVLMPKPCHPDVLGAVVATLSPPSGASLS